MMNARTLIAAGLALASLAACSPPADAPAATTEPPLAGARIGGDFTALDEDGKPFTQADLLGRYAIVYFGYTYCPDVCPIDVAKLMNGLRAFERADPARAAEVLPLFVSVDPARDTPATLAAFTDNFHPRLIGLTGSAEQIAQLAKAYAVGYHKIPGSAPDAYLMAHSQMAFLMGPDGQPIALLPIDDASTPMDEGAPALVAAELAHWVKPIAAGGEAS